MQIRRYTVDVTFNPWRNQRRFAQSLFLNIYAASTFFLQCIHLFFISHTHTDTKTHQHLSAVLTESKQQCLYQLSCIRATETPFIPIISDYHHRVHFLLLMFICAIVRQMIFIAHYSKSCKKYEPCIQGDHLSWSIYSQKQHKTLQRCGVLYCNTMNIFFSANIVQHCFQFSIYSI